LYSNVHDHSYHLYEAAHSNPNLIKQRVFKQHYRHLYPGQDDDIDDKKLEYKEVRNNKTQNSISEHKSASKAEKRHTIAPSTFQ